MQGGWWQGFLSDFMLGAQATGTEVKALGLSVSVDLCSMNIGYPAPVGPAFGVTDIMTELG